MYKYRYILLLYSFGATANAQDTAAIQLKEFTVTATRTALSYKQLAQSVTSIKSEDIANMLPQTTGDILQKTGLITVQKSQQGGGSPILRGFEANRVLLVVDGVRMNNIIYRGGHLQNAITVDPNILERVEVLFGPASSVYGSDALGGVIHLISKNPEYQSKPKLKSGLHLRYSTVNEEKMLHYDLQYGSKKVAGFLSVTTTEFDDLRGGRVQNPFYAKHFGDRNHYYKRQDGKDLLINNSATPWLQIASGYSQIDLMGKLKIQSKTGLDHTFNVQYSASTDIPRYDRLTDPNPTNTLRFAEWYYGPQKRLFTSYNTDFHSKWPIKLNVNYQFIEESRHQRTANSSNLQSRIERVNILGFDAFHQSSFRASQWVMGLDGQQEWLGSTAHTTEIVTKTTAPLDTRYPAGSNHMTRLSAYTIWTNQLNNQWNAQASARLGITNLASDFGSNEFFKFPFKLVKQFNLTYSANLGLSYNANEFSKWGVVLATGFRVPNVDDLAKVFESTTGTLIVPNPDLKPEKSISLEVNHRLSLMDQKSYITSSVYVTQLHDAIVTGPFSFNSQDSVLYNGVRSLVLANQNNRLARIFGISMDGQIFLSKILNVSFGGTYTHGRIIDEKKSTPLDHIPPLSGKLGLVANVHKFRTEVNVLGNDWKRLNNYLLRAEDNEQYATPDGMPAWVIFNVYSTYNFNCKVRLSVALENIMDTQYRVFASGINAPGRNLSTSLKLAL